ncbi:hypothetical protein BHE74_00053612 [Ensete ventricosum]|nr:hypothetical protein GW17_00011664 [Ensete ventricosum]RWW40938.1 hypothetical protein BHE74_00053612 [Ensete ventricosum]RZS25181.1 hypothetical protein BHM03_00058343 [Ensete ventricosum]
MVASSKRSLTEQKVAIDRASEVRCAEVDAKMEKATRNESCDGGGGGGGRASHGNALGAAHEEALERAAGD